MTAYQQERCQTVCLVYTGLDPIEEVRLYLKKQPAGMLEFYDRNGRISNAPHYTITQTDAGFTVRIPRTMMTGDLLILRYTA